MPLDSARLLHRRIILVVGRTAGDDDVASDAAAWKRWCVAHGQPEPSVVHQVGQLAAPMSQVLALATAAPPLGKPDEELQVFLVFLGNGTVLADGRAAFRFTDEDVAFDTIAAKLPPNLGFVVVLDCAFDGVGTRFQATSGTAVGKKAADVFRPIDTVIGGGTAGRAALQRNGKGPTLTQVLTSEVTAGVEIDPGITGFRIWKFANGDRLLVTADNYSSGSWAAKKEYWEASLPASGTTLTPVVNPALPNSSAGWTVFSNGAFSSGTTGVPTGGGTLLAVTASGVQCGWVEVQAGTLRWFDADSTANPARFSFSQGASFAAAIYPKDVNGNLIPKPVL